MRSFACLRALSLLAAPIVLVAACSGSPITIVMANDDGGAAADASGGPRTDAGGTPDAGGGIVPDAGTPSEGGMPVTADGGPMVDGGGAVDASDAAAPDSGDAASADAAPPSTACGAVPACRYGQTCVAGACEYVGCVGAHVPGDYATFEAAILAIGNAGGTICLGAGDFSHKMAGNDPYETMTLQHDVTIVGVSAAKTSIGAWKVQGPGALTIRGASMNVLEMDPPWNASATFEACDFEPIAGYAYPALWVRGTTTATVRGSHIGAPNASGSGISTAAQGGATTLVVEACDLEDSIFLWPNDPPAANDSLTVTIRNDWFHGVEASVLLGVASKQPAGSVTIANNTFDGAQDDVFVATGSGAQHATFPVTIANNVFAHATDAAIGVGGSIVSPWIEEDDAFFGNAANYAGTAVPGGYPIDADCLLTASSPPSLGAGSPCRGKAITGFAPPNDYWGAPRGASPDLGAVQASP